jgi:hypothetical protein
MVHSHHQLFEELMRLSVHIVVKVWPKGFILKEWLIFDQQFVVSKGKTELTLQ